MHLVIQTVTSTFKFILFTALFFFLKKIANFISFVNIETKKVVIILLMTGFNMLDGGRGMKRGEESRNYITTASRIQKQFKHS